MNKPKTPKEKLQKSGESFKEAGKNIIETTVGAAITVGKTTEGLYNAIDAGDLAIYSKLGKSSNKVVNFTKRNILKLLLVGSIVTYGGYQLTNNDGKDNDDKRQEQESKVSKSNLIKFSNLEKNIFWNQASFFDQELDEKIKNNKSVEKLGNGIILLHDAGLTFYLMTPDDVQKGDKKNSSRTNTIEYIREKIGNVSAFSYLQDDHYKPTDNVVTNSFNIRPDFSKLAKNSSLEKTPFRIPIPMKKEIRKIENEPFTQSGEIALDVIENYNKEYGYIRKKISDEYGKENIAKLLTSIALVETGKTTQKIGTDTYHRWETGSHDCFSFGPSHVLMEHGGLKSRKSLGVTEGQMYHPTISNMVVMGFMIEKFKERGTKNKDKIAEKLINILKFTNEENLSDTDESLIAFSKFYNGGGYKSNKYNVKLKTALTITSIDTDLLEDKGDFSFKNINTSGSHIIYSYTIPNSNENIGEINEIIIEKFKKEYKIKSSNTLICRKNGNKYSDKIIHKQGDTIYIKLPVPK